MAGRSGKPYAEQELDSWVAHFRRLQEECVLPPGQVGQGVDPVDFLQFRRGLRLGRFAALDSLDCRPLDLHPGAWSWLRLRRTVRPRAEVRHPLSDVLAGLARARVAVLLLIQGGNRGVHIGLPRDAAQMGAWTQSVLAPGSLLEPTPGGPDLDLQRGVGNGLRFALLPQQTERGRGRDEATALPGLGRLLLMPGDDWSVTVRLDPLSLLQGMRLRSQLVSCSSALARHKTHTDSSNPQRPVSVEDPEVARLLDHLGTMLSHLDGGESAGLWFATVQLTADTVPELEMLTSAAASILEEETFSGGRWTGDRLVVNDEDPELPLPVSLLSTLDVAALLAPPAESVPGLEVTVQPPAGRSRQRQERPLWLGEWSGVRDRFAIGVEDLEGHGFITGTTGSGKSTTAQRLLAELWNEHEVPFLVIDPVKADYEAVAPSLRGGMLVVDAAQLRLNVLEPYAGFPLRTHLELVSNAFKGSFTLPSPVPYIVSQLFEQLITRAATDPPPTLHELRDLLDPFVAGLGYDSQVSSNIRASLGTRLSLLLSPSKAERLAAPRSVGLDALFEQPTVVQLANMGDDEERAFLMSILTLFVLERARSLGTSPSVRHLTVLEEAHRILPEPVHSSDPEAGDAASVSARLLTQMLAEIRSYGEAVLVVDQSPSAVARDVVKNTNLKIAHKVLDPSDREVIGGSMGLPQERQESIATLARGQAVVLTRRLPDPQTVAVGKAPNHPDNTPLTEIIRGMDEPSDQDPRPCCRGKEPAQHHAAERRSREAESVMSLAIAGLIVGSGGRDRLWSQVDQGLTGLALRDPVLAGRAGSAERCLALVGLRRAILQFVEQGLVPSERVGRILEGAFKSWLYQRRDPGLESLRKVARPQGPYRGCTYCDCKCLFRHQGAVSQEFGLPALQSALAGEWLPQGKPLAELLLAWQLSTTATLKPILGNLKHARGAALCAVTQGLHAMQAPTTTHEKLLVRGKILDDPQPAEGD